MDQAHDQWWWEVLNLDLIYSILLHMLSLLRRASTTRLSLATFTYRRMSSNPPDFKQFKLALIQLGSPSHLTENPTPTDIKNANLKHARDMIDRAAKNSAGKPDLVVLPVRRFLVFYFPGVMTNPRNASTLPMALYTFLCTPKLSVLHPDKNMI